MNHPHPEDLDPVEDEVVEAEGDDECDDEVDEEISCEEVDRVLESLADLMEKVESETVHGHLDEVYQQIFHLVYEEEDEEDDDSPQAEAA